MSLLNKNKPNLSTHLRIQWVTLHSVEWKWGEYHINPLIIKIRKTNKNYLPVTPQMLLYIECLSKVLTFKLLMYALCVSKGCRVHSDNKDISHAMLRSRFYTCTTSTRHQQMSLIQIWRIKATHQAEISWSWVAGMCHITTTAIPIMQLNNMLH